MVYIVCIPVSGKLIELSMGGENDETDFSITQHRKLLRLFEKPRTALAKGHLPMHRVLNSPHLYLSSSHINCWVWVLECSWN